MRKISHTSFTDSGCHIIGIIYVVCYIFRTYFPYYQRWEFIKENKKTLSTKKAIKKKEKRKKRSSRPRE